LVVVEHAIAIAPSLQITYSIAADRLTSANSNSMSAAWKIGDSGRLCMVIDRQGFS